MAESIGANSAFQHILENIFENLNIDDLTSCQKVSPYWRKLLENKNFWLKNEKLDRSIHEIAKSGNVEALQFLNTIFTKSKLLEKSRTCSDASGRKAIHVACQEGHLEIVEFWTDSNHQYSKGWVLNQIFLENQTDGWSPIHYASCFGHAKIVKYVLKLFYKLVPNYRYYEYRYKAFQTNSRGFGKHAFHLSIIKGHIDVTKVFMNYGFNLGLTRILSPDYFNGIELAAFHGNLEIVKFLMPYWEENFRDTDLSFEKLYDIVLRRAASNGHLEVMKWVIPMVRNPFVFSTKLAQRFGCDELVDFVKSSGLVFQPQAKKSRLNREKKNIQ